MFNAGIPDQSALLLLLMPHMCEQITTAKMFQKPNIKIKQKSSAHVILIK